MDPLSITASIITILELTTKLMVYVNDVRHATREQAKVAVEASSLYGLLTRLRFRVEEARSSDPWLNQVKLLGRENGPLDQFKDILEKMVEQISSSRKRDQVKSALMWKFTKSEVDDALKRMERVKSLIQCALTEDLFTLTQAIHGDVGNLGNQMEQLNIRTERLQSHADQELQHRLLQWLGVPDPSTNYHAALKKRHPETGLWLVNGTHFDSWKSSQSSLMWLHGNAGCGKTILSAAALQSLIQHQASQPGIAVVYFYFDFNDSEKQSSRMAIRSLLFQLAQQSGDGLQGLEQLRQKCTSGQPSDDAIQSLLQSTMERMGSKYIVLDALDECTDREDLLTFLCDLVNSKLTGLRVMATSRREKDIEDHLRPISNYNIDIQRAVVDEDIEVYVRDRLATDPKLTIWPEVVKAEIITVMMEKANGMFRWVYCQLESIRQCIKLRALREALSTLPKTLDETYDRILQDLESRGHLRDAIKVLQWLCYSMRPLNTAEIVEILAIEDGEDGGFFPEDRLPDPADVMVVCSSLISCNAVIFDDGSGNTIIIEGQTTQIQLAHFSVKEYLLSDRSALRSDFQTTVCHSLISEGCLRYLLYLADEGPLTRKVVAQHPLARYAAEHWWRHAQEIDEEDGRTVFDLASSLLTVETGALLLWVRLCDPDYPWIHFDPSLKSTDIAQPLYYAASVGLSKVTKDTLLRTNDVNAQGGRYNTALQAAVYSGHENVVRMLLNAGAHVNARGGPRGTALQAALCSGHENVVQILLNAGAHVNTQAAFDNTALQAASSSGHENVVRILLNVGAHLNTQGGHYNTALQAASYRGYERVVQILLDAGADVNIRGGQYNTALQAASYPGHERVILLDAGADVNIRGGQHNTALQAAVFFDHKKVVQILLDAGADVNIRGGYYNTALQAASYYGYEKALQILLDARADVNIRGGWYNTALTAASLNGHKKVVQILLDARADVNIRGGVFSNALTAASIDGHENVVQILLDAGADVNTRGWSALQASQWCGQDRMEIDTEEEDYGNALQAASLRGHEKVVRMLLDAGANVNCGGWYALEVASHRGHEKVVQILLDAGVTDPGRKTSAAT
ncbi:hypothetical protein PV10_04684 [Exophiala mesophila]|uniref:NACHT domain-containing protein n=1 Tax=Exophiala mesophila TaxID=212818 RepID=A0A0D1ZFG3_EXOME|nr:uncharacterized protein PV10_04684 [Exophiala mesophila]KIV93472.1 hypothetical protein PV10_04684 [Exophiala mesophila]